MWVNQSIYQVESQICNIPEGQVKEEKKKSLKIVFAAPRIEEKYDQDKTK